MKAKTHKDLDVWKEAMKLAEEVYRLTSRFPKEELYGLALQMRRAAVSVASNVAEGAARASTREFVQFLFIASGSLSELETQVILAKNIGLLQNEEVLLLLERVRMMIFGLIRQLRKKPVALEYEQCLTDHEVTDHGSRITDYGSRFTDHGSRVTDHGSRFTDHVL